MSGRKKRRLPRGPFSWLFHLLFDGIMERSYVKERQHFVAEIENSFSYLLEGRAGTVVPYKFTGYESKFGGITVEVNFSLMRIQITRWRGELSVRIARWEEPEGWWELGSLIQFLPTMVGKRPPSVRDSLDNFAHALQDSWDGLLELFAEENWFPSLTNAEWRRFLRLPKEDRLAILASYKAKGLDRQARYFEFTAASKDPTHAD